MGNKCHSRFPLSKFPFSLTKAPASVTREPEAFVKEPGKWSFPGSVGNYLTVPRSFTVMAVSGMASMASDTVTSPLNMAATSVL